MFKKNYIYENVKGSGILNLVCQKVILNIHIMH